MGSVSACHRRVYPRVGGGNNPAATAAAFTRGLSPRGRGKRLEGLRTKLIGRSIPAWAGETAQLATSLQALQVYPRVGGGNREGVHNERGSDGLSPRGRGKLDLAPTLTICGGSIPAWAGETRPSRVATIGLWVYPRVGGGNRRGYPHGVLAAGLSPRGRGKQASWHSPRRLGGSIPAWAGETRPSAIQ